MLLPRCILLIVIAGAFQGVWGQQHAFIQYTPRDGLAQSQVRCMAHDGAGYLWFGTLGGASRFDGHAFHNLSLQDGLPDAQVVAMATDVDGSLWMGSGEHLVRARGMHLEQVPLPDGGGGRILSLVTGGNGDLFIGTEDGRVFHRTTNGIRPLEGYPADTASTVRALLLRPDGRLLIGLRNGLLEWHEGRCRRIDLMDGTPKSISALALGHDGSLWVGTFGEGLFHIGVDGRQTVHDEEDGLLQSNVRSLTVDAQGRLWVGTKFGLNLFEEGRMRSFTIYQGLPNDNIWCAFEDREGNLWLGTDGAGALKYTGDRFVTFTVTDGLCSDLVMTMVGDASDDIWLGTYGSGVCRLDGMAIITTVDGLPNNTIWSSLSDRNGDLWFGTSDGLCLVRQGRVVPLPPELRFEGQRVLALHADGLGRIWCGTRDGLSTIHPDGRVEHLPAHADGPGRSVRTIVEDAQGRLWVGSATGVTRIAMGERVHYPIPAGEVLCLRHDVSGRLWVGTSNGYGVLDGGHFRQTVLVEGFGSNHANLFSEDLEGYFWVGTNNGLFRFHPDSVLVDDSAFEHITMNEGLVSLESNLNASHLDPRGRLLFGTAAGLVLHDPRRGVRRSAVPEPVVHITGVRNYLQETDWRGASDSISALTGLPIGLHVPHGRNYLTFDYTGINFTAPTAVRYRYRLRGVHEDWLPATDARFASFSNLSHGDHAFEVVAAGLGGRWSEPATLSFRIERPFWLRWWFFLLCAGVVAAIWFSVERYRRVQRTRHERTRQLMLRSRMLQLEQQALNANMNRHFVFNALNSIQSYINRQDRASANRYLANFAKLIRKNLDASQSDTTTLAEEIERLELYLQLEHMRFKDRFRYVLEVEPGLDISEVRLPAMMLQPYVENAIWHGILPMERQGAVVLRIGKAGKDRVHVTIEDDGVGVDHSRSNKMGEGDHISRGIEITKGRADVMRRLHLGDVRIEGPQQMNDSGGEVRGTRVLIDLPLRTGDQVQGHLRMGDGDAIFGEG